MHVTDEMMNAAVEEYRRFKTAEDYYQRLNDSSDFRARLEAAYARGPSFFTVDAAGWRSTQFNVDIPPVPPIVNNAPEPDWTERDRRMKPIPGAAFPS
jgi:hypothetical protein